LIFRRLERHELRNVGDLGEFLTEKIMEMAADQEYNKEQEAEAFRFAFRHLAASLEDHSFRRYDAGRSRFIGGFLISAFEVLAIGLGSNYEGWHNGSMTVPDVREKAQELWSNQEFLSAIGSGVRGSSRIPFTIPFGREYFRQ
jgi:hypothetical protein